MDRNKNENLNWNENKHHKLPIGFKLSSKNCRLSTEFWIGYKKELDLLISIFSFRLLQLKTNNTGLKLIV